MVVQKNKTTEKKLEEMFSFEKPKSVNVKKNTIKNFFILFFAILSVLGVFGTYYFFDKYNNLKNDPSIVSNKDTDNILDRVSQLMVLPSDEAPTIATILDKDKLDNQPFFDESQNGDKLLMFNSAMKAILYRPSTNKIIKVAPININDSTSATSQNEDGFVNSDENITEEIKQEDVVVPSLNLKVAYYNGTFVANLSSQTAKNVIEKYPTYKTVAITNAKHRDYKGTLVIDISGRYSAEVNALAQTIGAKVSTLPEGEIKPDADILIISGK